MWLTNWTYRKKINLTGQSGAGTDYQVKLLVGESSGSAGVNFHVENHASSFPSDVNTSGDLRFTSDDGETLLDFYVESVSGTTPNRIATVYVEVSSDLDSNQSIYCYYSGITTNVSNGEDTFLFFDDFSVDLSKWTITKAGTSNVTIVSGEMNVYHDGTNAVFATCNTAFPSTFEIKCRGKAVDNKTSYFLRIINESNNKLVDILFTSGIGGQIRYLSSDGVTQYYWKGSNNTWTTTSTDLAFTANFNTYYRFRITKDATNWKISAYTDADILIETATIADSSVIAHTSIILNQGKNFGGSTYSGTLLIDNDILRKYQTTEPSFNTVETQESSLIYIETDTLLLSDEIELNVSLEKIIESDTLILSDAKTFGEEEEEDFDSLSLSDSIYTIERPQRDYETDTLLISDIIDVSRTKHQSEEDTLLLSDTIEARIPIEFIHNITSFVIQIIKNINNKFSMLKSNFINCTNQILFRKQGIYSCKNDFRMRGSWQVPGDAGIQSLGKEYIKVYIATIEQTDIDIDSISITKGLNNAHTANLILGRAYDATAPDIESVIEIKYNNQRLFKGYITQIIPTDNPENIQLYCEDEMWKTNKTRVYFQVGHLPYGASPDQYYYKYISTALSTLGINGGFGGICPQTINCWGKAKAEAITDLITQSGNLGWYYKEDGLPNYWRAGEGSIVTLESQEIGKNLGLYQVLSHTFKSDVANIINRFRVQMGTAVNALNQAYQSYDYQYFAYQPTPIWDSSLEILATPANALGFDYFHHKPENNYLYDNVFKKYKLSNESDLELALSKWTDRYAPRVEIGGGGFGWICSKKDGVQTDGFSIDYKKNGSITFNEPIYYKQLNEYGEIIAIRRAQVYVALYKKKLHTTSDNLLYPMWFYTAKMGDYITTNTGDLSLSGLSIQSGGRYTDENGNSKYIPSWNDTAFASDVANWELSKNCDEKIFGSIKLTLDAVCFYNIDLSKRILIPGVFDVPLNIINMTYNLSDFTVTLELENARSYYRSVSIQSRGNDYF